MNQRISQNKQQGSMNETGGTVSAGQWYTIVAWHNAVGNTLNIQVNNGTVNTVSYSGGAMDTTFPLVIGAHADGTFGLDGRIDELALYKRVLTPSERAWFHNGNGSGRAYVDLTAPVPTTTTTLAYDNAGRKTSMVDPDMGTWSYSYDALSNLKTQTDARGCTTSLNYDSLNRLTQKSYSNCPTTPTVNYYYDGQAFTFNGTNYNAYTNALGRRTGMMVAGSNANVWNYDTRGRLLSETVNAGTPYTTNLTYNSADMPLTMQYPDGEVVRNYYDLRMMLDKVDNTSGATYVNNLDYDSAGRLTVLALNNGLTQNYTYYAWDEKVNNVGQGGRLKTSTAGTLQNMSYVYDADGNIRSINNSITNPAEVQSFGYDVLDRLISASAVNGPAPYSETYGYDSATGNLASKGSLSNSYTYNAQVTCAAGMRTIPHAVSAAFGNAYEYDCNGNQKKRVISGGQTLALEYDAENRLVKVCQDTSNNAVCDADETVKASFVYDGDGRRVKSVMGSETILFVGAHYEIKNPGGGQEVTKYYFAGVQRVAVRKYVIPQSTTLTYLLGDHLGSTSLAVDASTGAVIETRYKPWGEVRYTTPNKTLPTRYTFTGQYSYVADEATDLGNAGFGLMFYNARMYDPAIGRFTSADSIVPGGVQGLDRYAYVNNSPIRYTDPSGHMCIPEDECGGTSNNAGNSSSFDNQYGISFEGNGWTNDTKDTFRTAVRDVAKAFLRGFNRGCRATDDCFFGSAADLFRIIFGTSSSDPLKFKLGSCEMCDGGHAYTHSAHLIEFNANNAFYLSTEKRSAQLAFGLNVHNVVHELGHAFANLWSRRGDDGKQYYEDGSPYMTSMNERLLGNSGYATPPEYASDFWQMHPDNGVEDDVVRQHESFADMFLGWVYGPSNMSSERQEFMTQMSGWVATRTLP